MKKMVSLIGCLMLILLPLTVLAATQSNVMDSRTNWYGGPMADNPSKVEGATLSEISAKATQEAALNDRPVEYKKEDGKIVYQAFPDYGKSKCGFVHGKTWEEGKLTQSKIIEVCNKNHELSTPYVPSVTGIPHGGAIR